jgi:hypothetical protein
MKSLESLELRSRRTLRFEHFGRVEMESVWIHGPWSRVAVRSCETFLDAVNKILIRVGSTLMLTLQISKLSIGLRGWGE